MKKTHELVCIDSEERNAMLSETLQAVGLEHLDRVEVNMPKGRLPRKVSFEKSMKVVYYKSRKREL